MFQTMMDDIFDGLIMEGVVVVYLDNILIFTETLEEHQRVTRRVMELLWKNNLFLKPKKCEFEKTEVEYLGVIMCWYPSFPKIPLRWTLLRLRPIQSLQT